MVEPVRRGLTCLLALILNGGGALASADDELSGTAWRLVQIMSMDDGVYLPDGRGTFSLTLEDGGRAAIEAGCNRAAGKRSSDAAGRLRFDLRAATEAACRPGSISESYLAQFAWVRSYVIQDGHPSQLWPVRSAARYFRA